MGIKDFLNKYLPKPIINKLLDVKFGGDKVSIYDINIEKFQYIVYDPQIEGIGRELIEREKIGYGRADLAFIISRMVSLTKTQEEMIEVLKPYLHPWDHSAMIGATAIIKLEDEGKDSRKPLERFGERYGARGKKIYNLLRSKIYRGKTIFEGIIFPFAILLKRAFQDENMERGIFIKFFEDALNFYPYGIWIERETTTYDVLELIEARINEEPISIYARGGRNIDTAERAIRKFIVERDHGKFEFKRINYPLGKSKARMITILKK